VPYRTCDRRFGRLPTQTPRGERRHERLGCPSGQPPCLNLRVDGRFGVDANGGQRLGPSGSAAFWERTQRSPLATRRVLGDFLRFVNFSSSYSAAVRGITDRARQKRVFCSGQAVFLRNGRFESNR
jgi:hypothetical protein